MYLTHYLRTRVALRRVLLLAALRAVDILAAQGVASPPEADSATSGPATCLLRIYMAAKCNAAWGSSYGEPSAG